MADWNEVRMIDQWKETSELVHKVRHGIEPAGFNSVLDGLVQSASTICSRRCMRFGLLTILRFPCVSLMQPSATRNSRITLKTELSSALHGVHALRSAADSFVRLNSITDAVRCFERLLKEYEGHVTPEEIWTRVGSMYEDSGIPRRLRIFSAAR